MEHQSAPSSTPERIGSVHYFYQDDPRWKDRPYSVCGDPEQTIGTSGCMPTQQAMLVSSLTPYEVAPTLMAEFNVAMGFRTPDNGTKHEALFALEAMGVQTFRLYSVGDIQNALAAGGLVTVSALLPADGSCDDLPGSASGHIYGIHRLEGRYAWVNDPKNVDKSLRPYLLSELTPTFLERGMYASFARETR